MEIRGSGNLLGAEQHGHMEAVGYELYIKLLNAAVLEERGELPLETPECTVSVDLDAYLPDAYVAYPAQRMALYKRIALIRNRDDMEDMIDELTDRYGDLPRAAQNLLMIALIRAEAIACGIKSVKQTGHSVLIAQDRPDLDVWSELADIHRGRLRFVMGAEAAIRLSLRPEDDILAVIHKVFVKYFTILAEKG